VKIAGGFVSIRWGLDLSRENKFWVVVVVAAASHSHKSEIL
jgi:hypothetical protein